jgi:hypothetical protein
MTIIQFPEYRQYEAIRVEINNAMMGLLAGAQLAVHLLKLTEGSDQLLPRIFPGVPHIGRFNIQSSAARQILTEADVHLGAMAVPYALALHEDYARTCVAFLERATLATRAEAENLTPATIHEFIRDKTQQTLPAASLEQFHTLRLMRNALIHRGGRASRSLIEQVNTWSLDTEAGWKNITGRTLRGIKEGEVLQLGHGELILTLAVTKNLARRLNEILQAALQKSLWADVLIEDLMNYGPGLPRDPHNQMRKAKGYARYFYAALGLSEHEIKDAITRHV